MAEAIRFVEYNNKSRKGKYIVIKKKGRNYAYKYDSKLPIDYYEEKAGSVKKGKSKKKWTTKEIQKKVNVAENKKQLSKQFKKGQTLVIVNMEELGKSGATKKVYEKTLGPLVINKKLLQSVIANKEKLRNGFAYKIYIYGEGEEEQEQLIGKIKDIGRYTPEEIHQKYRKEAQLKPGRKLGQNELENLEYKMKLAKGSVKQYAYQNTIKRVMIHIQFQK